MEKLEAEMRKKLIFVMIILVIACTVVDTSFFIYYAIGDMLDYSPEKYVIKRIVLPLLIDLVCYFGARIYNGGHHSDRSKNIVCAVALQTIAGSMTISHSYFTVIWCAPATATMFGMVFHDRKLSRGMLAYSYILVGAALFKIILEHPEEKSYYIQSAVIVFIMNMLFYMVGDVMQTHNEKVIEHTREMYMTQQEYREQLQYDALTGVYSRRHLMERANLQMSKCQGGHPVSVAIIDIDNFKSINDTYGHEQGDVVLRRLGSLLSQRISENTTIGRYGGEEFVFVCDSDDTESHLTMVEEIRTEFESQKYDFLERKVTFSGGFITCFDTMDFDDVLQQADEALYHSKKNGKNQITVCKQESR